MTQGLDADVNALVAETVRHIVSGAVSAATSTLRYYNNTGKTVTLTKVRASLGTAGTATSTIVDVNKNGTSVFATGKPTIAISGNTATAVPPATVTLADGDYLTFDVDQAGTSAANLVVEAVLV